MSAGKLVPLRPRAEVSRGVEGLPPKSRRRYKRSGHREGYMGRFQSLLRWSVMGKIILVDWRPCYRCRLAASACASCQHPRRATAPEGKIPRAENSFVLHVADQVPITALWDALGSAGFTVHHDPQQNRLVLAQSSGSEAPHTE